MFMLMYDSEWEVLGGHYWVIQEQILHQWILKECRDQLYELYPQREEFYQTMKFTLGPGINLFILSYKVITIEAPFREFFTTSRNPPLFLFLLLVCMWL